MTSNWRRYAAIASLVLVASAPAALAQGRLAPKVGGAHEPAPTIATSPATRATLTPSVGSAGASLGATAAPAVQPTAAAASPPAPPDTEQRPDPGGSECACPDGQTTDVNGRCWSRAPDTGEWRPEGQCGN